MTLIISSTGKKVERIKAIIEEETDAFPPVSRNRIAHRIANGEHEK